MSTGLVQVEGAIIFRVTDLQLAIQIDQLLKKNNQASIPLLKTTKLKVHNGNGKAKKNPETKDRVLQMLKERYSSNQFDLKEAAPLIKTALGVSLNAVRRALKVGIEKGMLEADGRGTFHFLELALTPDLPATGT